ncbi:MAG: glycosyltransferase [Desulfobacteraceae bacterium]|nr:MAG: glycosyltransferase [Desulfobacteraceae bacterium]
MERKYSRISIVTPSLNQARFIRETIESVMAQDYPDFEHIIMDGGSKDGTIDILKEYRHLKVISEPDRGQGDAINKGFNLTTGEILAYLNADDTLLPGALKRVGEVLNPRNGPFIVMGRCRFTDEFGKDVGIEHPSEYESHSRVLKVWKGHTIPQPAVFWARRVWDECGPMEEGLSCSWIDYDLFCRFSRRYDFYSVGDMFATYRLHTDSKTCQVGEEERLMEAISVSRRYWGAPVMPKYWGLAFSLAAYKFNRRGRARTWMRKSGELYRKGNPLGFLHYGISGLLLAPEVAFNVYAYPRLRARGGALMKKILHPIRFRSKDSPQTNVFLRRTDPWDDGWVGPKVIMQYYVEDESSVVELLGYANLQFLGNFLKLTVAIDGQKIGTHEINKDGDFYVALSLPKRLSPGMHTLEIEANSWYVPNKYLANSDFRPLSWRMERISFQR